MFIQPLIKQHNF